VTGSEASGNGLKERLLQPISYPREIELSDALPMAVTGKGLIRRRVEGAGSGGRRWNDQIAFPFGS